MPSERPTVPEPPRAKTVPHVWHRPTGDVDDPFAWLIDRDDPDTVAYLNAENGYSDAWFGHHDALIEELFDEIRSRVQETDLSAPVRKGPWWYVTRTEEGAAYPIHCRGATPETATDHVLLDQNAEADGHSYFAVDAFDVSEDHRFLAWSSDTDGSERYTLRVRDLDTGAELPDVLTGTSYGGTAWSADGSHLFYVMPDDAMRPYQVWRHALGTEQATDVLVYEEPDERFFVSVELSRSSQWIVITAGSHTSGDVRVIPAADPAAPSMLIRPRMDDVEYGVDHAGVIDGEDCFVVLTNHDAEDFRVMTAPVADPVTWTEIVPHVEGRRIVSVQAFRDHLLLHEWADAQQRLRILIHGGPTERTIDLGDEPHEVELDANPEWSATTVRFRYQSLTTPPTVYEEPVAGGERTLLKQHPVPNTDLDRYVSTREWATAPDGTRVPVDVVRRRDVDGPTPCLIYGYGSYEVSLPPWFSVLRLSLLDRGWTWALVHPRGGGELGRRWYLEGKLLNKRNTFTDTIACAEHLERSGWAAPGRTAVRGGSAGGLLVGACITMRPDLWGAAVAEVPFVDVVSTMSDPTLPLTVTEWEEWGDPRDEPFASYIEGYSPYDQTVPAHYPPMFVTAGLNDPRVSYHEPAKWAARLRQCQQGDAPILLRTEMGAGHAGSSGRYDRWRDEARVMAFLLATINVDSD